MGAEMITKADEYSTESPAEGLCGGLHCVLLVRCVAGRAHVTNEKEPDKAVLRSVLKDAVCRLACHSVYGERTKIAGNPKPYNEVVIYDADQVYPEYLPAYRRE